MANLPSMSNVFRDTNNDPFSRDKITNTPFSDKLLHSQLDKRIPRRFIDVKKVSSWVVEKSESMADEDSWEVVAEISRAHKIVFAIYSTQEQENEVHWNLYLARKDGFISDFTFPLDSPVGEETPATKYLDKYTVTQNGLYYTERDIEPNS